MSESIFTVIDTRTGSAPDLEAIALHEAWAHGLIYCDMEGFSIEEDGTLMLADECGNLRYPPEGRFRVVWSGDQALRDERDRLREALRSVSYELAALFPVPNNPTLGEAMTVCGNRNEADARCIYLAYEAARAALTLAGQRWTRSTPTEPGWYWWRNVETGNEPEVWALRDDGDGLEVVGPFDETALTEWVAEMGGEWQGPIFPSES